DEYRAKENQWQEVDQQAEHVIELARLTDAHAHTARTGLHAGAFQHFQHAGAALFARAQPFPVLGVDNHRVARNFDLIDLFLAREIDYRADVHVATGLGWREHREEDGDQRHQNQQINKAIAQPPWIHSTLRAGPSASSGRPHNESMGTATLE